MKRFISVFLIISVLFSLVGCSQLYSEAVTVDGLDFYVNQSQNRCFVGSFTYDPSNPVTEIVIPDYYDGVPVTQIGGYYGFGAPVAFMIVSASAVAPADEDSGYSTVLEEALDKYDTSLTPSVVDINFTLHIGKNVEVIEEVYINDFWHVNDDGSMICFHPILKISCSEENETFYSKNGKLYFKENDTLVSAFYSED